MPSHRDHSSSPRQDRERERGRDRPRDRSSDRHRDRDLHSKRRYDDFGRDDSGRRDDRDEIGEYDRKRDRRKDERYDRDDRRSKRKDKGTPSGDDDLLDLKELGVDEISEDDYFLKSDQFKFWLKEERAKYLDEMPSESAHKYFRKFVRRWNDGALKERYYHSKPSTALPSSSNTAYKWSFANNRNQVDKTALAAARADVDRLTHSSALGIPSADDDDDAIGPSLATLTPGPSVPSGSSGPPGASTRLGPSLPTASDRRLAIEDEMDARKVDRKARYKQGYAKADEMVPKSVGKEGKMDEKRATNMVNKELREKEVGGLEVDEGTLMGESGSFAAALKARDAMQNRRSDKRAIDMADRRAADDERLADRKRKESATMDMFKAMAKERFG